MAMEETHNSLKTLQQGKRVLRNPGTEVLNGQAVVEMSISLNTAPPRHQIICAAD